MFKRVEPDAETERTYSVSELDDVIRGLDARTERKQERWLIGLAVANAAGLTAVGARIFDVLAGGNSKSVQEGVIALALPSVWLFLIGLALAGLTFIGDQITDALDAVRLRSARKRLVDSPEAVFVMGPGAMTWKTWFEIWGMEALSALCFMGGLTYPAMVLSLRYIQQGAFLAAP